MNENVGLQLSEPNYDTIAGYVIGKLGRVPRLNDEVQGDKVHLKVEKMDGMRIERILLSLIGEPSSSPPQDID